MDRYFTIIIGSGAAAYNCADCLYELGVRDIAIITENRNFGTSRNTGSDKQTYYKLGIAGDVPDSVASMAQALYAGGGVDGDICLTEAANSLKAFYKLCEAGVPFPTNRYGEYVGYKTDHDPLQRATSVGPLTSKMMTEALEKLVERKGIAVIDHTYVAQIVTDNGTAVGITAVQTRDKEERVVAIAAQNIVLATGGPAAIYRDSVYPACHTGSSSLAVRAGAQMSNLCEWQYGLASTKFRWNVSGTYQQVLPRYISVSPNGAQREFLLEYFPSAQKALDMVFLKGYQWPFDSAKIRGSSMIDLIVHYETNVLGNRVYMDFRTNPTGMEDFEALSEETKTYLKKSHATGGTPLDRLRAMNPDAIELYRSHGIDLESEPLEVAVCAQHCNGGVLVDTDYQSTVKNLYVCGEAAGTFGLYRPGGSALNSGQVGALRAAQSIAMQEDNGKSCCAPIEKAAEQLKTEWQAAKQSDAVTAAQAWRQVRAQMSEYASFIRIPSKLSEMKRYIANLLKTVLRAGENMTAYFKSRDAIYTAGAVLDAMLYACEHAGSRGGAIYAEEMTSCKDGAVQINSLPERPGTRELIVLTTYAHNDYITTARKRRRIPATDDWFENVWRDYRERHSVKENNKACRQVNEE